MGWNTAAHNKVALVGADAFRLSDNAALPKAPHVYVDGPAWIRRYCVGTTPPQVIARRVYADIASISPQTAEIFMDVRQRMPPARHGLWARRYAKAPNRVATETEVQNVTFKSLGTNMTWDVLLANSSAKTAMFNLLFAALTTEIVAHQGGSIEWLITRPNSTDDPWVFPFALPKPVVARYGEAEAQMVIAIQTRVQQSLTASTEVPRCLVLTIDTDIILQLAGICCRKVLVVLSKVWVEPTGTVHRVKGKSTAQAALRWEQFVCDKLIDGYTRDQVLWRMFCWLCAGGVDYCKGLGRFGWTVTAVATLLKHPPVFRTTENGFEVSLPSLCSALKQTRKTKRGDKPVPAKQCGAEGLVNELNSIIYCMRYYTWQFCDMQDVAGPPEVDLVPPPSSVSETVAHWLLNPPRLIIAADGDGSFGPAPAFCPHANDAAVVRQYLS